MNRINKLRKLAFEENGFEGYLILNYTNQLYFLGFPGTVGLLVPLSGECTAYVYGVNYEQAKVMGKGFDVELVKADENLMGKIAQRAAVCNVKKLAVDSLSVQGWLSLEKEFSHIGKVEVNNCFIEEMRLVKDEREIEFMRKAGELTSEGMRVACEAVKPGAKEYEVAAEAEYAMRSRGSGPVAFESIVASGACSAFPHGGCSGREIQEGDLVVVDIGATYQSYCSDMTRTVVAGKSSSKQQKIFDVVKLAQQEAFEAAQSGILVADLDAVARRVVRRAGFGEYFVHRLGHGVGLEVHERPSMSSNSKEKLEVGNVVTDEPGIYMPSFGGVRIEDTLLVGQNGAERLTHGSYSLERE